MNEDIRSQYQNLVNDFFYQIDWESIGNNSQSISAKQSNYLIVPTSRIEKTIEDITDKARNTGSIPEKFPSKESTIPVEGRSYYLTASLRETRNRLSKYYSVCNGMG